MDFDRLNATLRDAGIGRPVMLLDLDAVDRNIAVMRRYLDAPRLRVVTKSLPSIELLRHVMRASGSDKLMAFHLPYVPHYLREFPDADILMGKPFLPAAIVECLDAIDEAAAARVQWLVDSRARLAEHLDIARARGVNLRVSIEIDVGLHRGGITNLDELDDLLDDVDRGRDAVTLSGLMGYEAHAPHYPDPDAAHARAMAAYGSMANRVAARYPGVAMTFNSGGSNTYQRFASGEGTAVVTDVAAGSAVVLPSTFDLAGHAPALYLAAPVIRRFATVSRRAVAPGKATSLYVYGGGWAANVVSPAGLVISDGADPPNQNLLPNQCLFHAPADVPAGIGDFVFFHPHQGDAIVQFEELLVLKGGTLADTWAPVPRRY